MLINYLNVLSPSSLLCSLFWDVTLCTYVHCNAWCYDDLVIPSQPPPFITLAPLWRTRACRHHQDTPKKEKNRETQEWYQHNPKKKKKKKKKTPGGKLHSSAQSFLSSYMCTAHLHILQLRSAREGFLRGKGLWGEAGQVTLDLRAWGWNTRRRECQTLCSPSSSVASPLWIWTCSSCAFEGRWWWCWWDTRGTKRVRGTILSDTTGMSPTVDCIGLPHTSLAFCSMVFSADEGFRCGGVLRSGVVVQL